MKYVENFPPYLLKVSFILAHRLFKTLRGNHAMVVLSKLKTGEKYAYVTIDFKSELRLP